MSCLVHHRDKGLPLPSPAKEPAVFKHSECVGTAMLKVRVPVGLKRGVDVIVQVDYILNAILERRGLLPWQHRLVENGR